MLLLPSASSHHSEAVAPYAKVYPRKWARGAREESQGARQASPETRELRAKTESDSNTAGLKAVL